MHNAQRVECAITLISKLSINTYLIIITPSPGPFLGANMYVGYKKSAVGVTASVNNYRTRETQALLYFITI